MTHRLAHNMPHNLISIFDLYIFEKILLLYYYFHYRPRSPSSAAEEHVVIDTFNNTILWHLLSNEESLVETLYGHPSWMRALSCSSTVQITTCDSQVHHQWRIQAISEARPGTEALLFNSVCCLSKGSQPRQLMVIQQCRCSQKWKNWIPLFLKGLFGLIFHFDYHFLISACRWCSLGSAVGGF